MGKSNMSRFRFTPSLVSCLATVFGLLAPAAITHAQVLESTSDLRNACQQAPGNTITIQSNTKISHGAIPRSPSRSIAATIVIRPTRSVRERA
jgi:hypothetical protein